MFDDAEGAMPHIHAVLNSGKIMAFGNGKCIVGGQKGDDDLDFMQASKPAKVGQQEAE